MEGTEGLAARWQDEAGRRFSDTHENRLVIGLSGRDLEFGLSTARSRLNLANILDGASHSSVEVFVVGPHPRSIPPGTSGLPSSTRRLPMSQPGGITTTLTLSPPCSITSSGGRTLQPTEGRRARRATG